jgi:hypothetical protein
MGGGEEGDDSSGESVRLIGEFGEQ